ncbi:MAG: ornithine carbamoyltransferase [Candidatus Azotimanducaceae bacterium]
MPKRDFLTLSDLSKEELEGLLLRAIKLKQERSSNIIHNSLAGKTGILILAQNSTRTRIAFEAGMNQLGGHSLFLSDKDSQASRGEPLEDFARVVSEMADIVMTRQPEQKSIELLAKHASIPVINGMSSELHPCQLLADMQTFLELKGSIEGCSVAFIGDGFNMCNSYIEASKIFQFKLNIASPKGFEPASSFLTMSSNAELYSSVEDAVKGVDLVVTDVWSSMDQTNKDTDKIEAFQPYQVNEQLLDLSDEDAIFMHCLPAHRGEEISAGLLDHKKSVVWQEAGNRLHTQKALLEFLLKPV